MYKLFLLPAIIAFTLIFFAVPGTPADANWWQRPCIDRRFEERTVPIEVVDGVADAHFDATCPTEVPAPEPTAIPDPTAVPQNTQGNNNPSGNKDDPCAPGKSFTGPYCGWSPDHDRVAGASDSRVGGPEVLGLSNTSGSDLILSDILVLLGILCLLTYAKTKLNPLLAPARAARRAASFANDAAPAQ